MTQPLGCLFLFMKGHLTVTRAEKCLLQVRCPYLLSIGDTLSPIQGFLHEKVHVGLQIVKNMLSSAMSMEEKSASLIQVVFKNGLANRSSPESVKYLCPLAQLIAFLL